MSPWFWGLCIALRSFEVPLASHQEFCGEYNDATLVVLLATLTKARMAVRRAVAAAQLRVWQHVRGLLKGVRQHL